MYYKLMENGDFDTETFEEEETTGMDIVLQEENRSAARGSRSTDEQNSSNRDQIVKLRGSSSTSSGKTVLC